MSDHVKKAREFVRDVMKEFEPARDHAVGASREFLLALRSVVDAEIALLDKATQKKPRCGCGGPTSEPPTGGA